MDILRHRFLVIAVWRLVITIGRLGRLAEAAQIGRDHRVGFGQLRDQRPPHVAVLRVAVQQNDWLTDAGGEVMKPHSVKLGEVTLDARRLVYLPLGHGERSYRPVRASECTQPCMRFLALAMSSLEKKSSGLTLSIG